MPQITQIPLPGDAGQTPTGALQFEDDWPGMFIRGDSAFFVMTAIRRLQAHFQDSQEEDVTAAMAVLESLADTIDQNVIVHCS